MLKNIIIIMIIIIIIICIIIRCNLIKINESFNNNIIPKIILQTYHNKTRIPSKVYNNISKYAKGYKHIIYDDLLCIVFLKQNYPPIISETFTSLKKGPHKADLFRYCFLYKYGGIYLDVKTELIKPLDEIFTGSYLYTVLSKKNKCIYQGIIATPPLNPIFKILIDYIVNNRNSVNSYEIFVYHFYHTIQKYCQTIELKNGININKKGNINFYLFNEVCSRNTTQCYDGLDRYGFCCNIYDQGKKIIKTRYSDYPW
jgi:hypothetical protein